VQCAQQYSSDDGYIISSSTTLPYCCNNRITKNHNNISMRKMNSNPISSCCTSFEQTTASLPIATTILPYCNQSNLTNYNNVNSCSLGGNCSRNSSFHQLKPSQHQQFNKDDTLTSPTHKYNTSSNVDNKIVNSMMLQCPESYDYYHASLYSSNRDCCSTTNNFIKPTSTSLSLPIQQPQQQQQQHSPFLASYSPCQERHYCCRDFDLSRTQLPLKTCNPLQLSPCIPTAQSMHSYQCQPKHQSHQPIQTVLINPDDEALFAWLRSVGLNR
ncbi:unnamed protein product, partial [Schistosoma turkestanicum]